MPSIFHSEKTVDVNGAPHRIEADETIEGTQFFKVTNLETDKSDTTKRRGNKAYVDHSMRTKPFPEDFITALKKAEEVTVVDA